VPLSERPVLWLGILLVILGVQFLFFGLIAEMLTRTYHESQGKAIYVVREIIGRSQEDGEKERLSE
ncbi:MAG TPA: hypothetical protein VII92_13005, partial [Anaerolineae bacterium]